MASGEGAGVIACTEAWRMSGVVVARLEAMAGFEARKQRRQRCIRGGIAS